MRAKPPAHPARRAVAGCAALATVLVLVVASASAPSPARAAPGAGDAVVADHASPGAQLVLNSLSLIGVRYRLGGDSPETGLDCSGFVRHVFRETLGFTLPRRSEEMSRAGTPVPRERLQPGDLVFFNTLRRAFSHVGIYIGEDRFVHAPSTGGRVRVESIRSRYWARRFSGARRIAPEPVYAAAVGEPAAAPPAAAEPTRGNGTSLLDTIYAY